MTIFLPSALIFDMDGTIVDNARYHTQGWLELFAELGVEMTADELHLLIGGRTTEGVVRQIFGDHISNGEVRKYSERKEALYRAIYRPHLRPVEGLDEFLSEARCLGIPMAVATSAGMENIKFVLGGLGIESYFAVVVGADEVEHGKTGPEMFLVTAQRLDVSPERCLVFEDSLAGIEAARHAGMRTIVVTNTPEVQRFEAIPSVLKVVRDFTPLKDIVLLGIRVGE